MVLQNNNILNINGYCKQEVNNIAATIRKKKLVDKYKGKGIKYLYEKIILKEIKKK
jgi:large subunit ribosomal protein L6